MAQAGFKWCAAAAFFASAMSAVAASPGSDYVVDAVPSRAAKACFASLKQGIEGKRIAKSGSCDPGEEDAWFTEDGSISIPPGGMITFKMAGRCMDPHLPAPASGEPMQFVDRSKLIPLQLRSMYDNLLKKISQGDPRVAAANPQHLVWAIRTAGSDDPIANSLSDAQLEVLDECAGRRGAFLRYHEREKRRNARKNRKGRGERQNRIAVGGLSYDAAELCGTNAAQLVDAHIAELTEMGRSSTIRTDADFRYGEIDEELYSDVIGSGGLSFSARVVNASNRRREFRAADFVAQVGNGSAKGGMRQRVTMCDPGEFVFFSGAATEIVETESDVSVTEVDARQDVKIRGRSRRRRGSAPPGGNTDAGERRGDTPCTPVQDSNPVVPVPPAPQIEPVPRIEVVTNEVPALVPFEPNVELRVVSLEYDPAVKKGVVTVEIVAGSFKKAVRFLRRNFDGIVRKQSPRESAEKIPAAAKLAIDSIGINEDGLCKVGFTAKESKK